ncbi:bifunctional glutamate N-acetyltransferase/amino-acid acetyltransferase ArgJ [Salinispira pacifica]
MEGFSSEAEYLEELRRRAVLPAGFRVSTGRLTFTPNERPTQEPYRMNLSLLLADRPTEIFAAVLTRNAFPGAPVLLARNRLREPSVRGILVNNKIANVCTASGVEDAERLLSELSALIDVPAKQLFSVSTGIIGWSLPVPDMVGALPATVEALHGGDAVDFARGIMTTDAFPKVRSVSVGEGSIVACAKGAGMIEPNMATMLVFIVTDVAVSREDAQAALSAVAERSFNRISVDSDQSTSDMALLLSSAQRGSVPASTFQAALEEVCGRLAEDIVRNGEGTGHVIRVRISGMQDEATAVAAGKAVVNSPLVKTAIYGNDPNVGRIVSSLGDYAGNSGVEVDRERLFIRLGQWEVFSGGVFHLDRDKETRLSSYLQEAAMNPRIKGYPQHDRCVDIHADFGLGKAEAVVLGSDLSHEYIQENADYRT